MTPEELSEQIDDLETEIHSVETLMQTLYQNEDVVLAKKVESGRVLIQALTDLLVQREELTKKLEKLTNEKQKH